MAAGFLIPGVSTANARLEVEVTSGTGKVIAYGSGIANGSQDPTTFEMTYAPPEQGQAAVAHDATLVGDGTAAAPLGLAEGAVTQEKIAAGEASAGRVLITDGTHLKWRDDSVTLPYLGSIAHGGDAFSVTNTQQGAILGVSPAGTAMTGFAGEGPRVPAPVEAPVGVYGLAANGVGVVGFSRDLPGVLGHSMNAEGLYGLTNSTYGVVGRSGVPISGALPAARAGVLGQSRDSIGVLGASTVHVGVTGSGSTGVAGSGTVGHGVHGQTTGAAAYGGSFVNLAGAGGGGAYVRGGSDDSADLVLGATGVGLVQGRIHSAPAYSYSSLGFYSNAGIRFRLDTDNEASVSVFHILAGNNEAVLAVEEDGDVLVPDLATGSSRPVYATATGYLTLGGASDARLKTDVAPLTDETDVLAALAGLRGVRYSWDAAQERARDLGSHREIGLLAQDVEAVLPEVVWSDTTGYRSLDYARLTAFLVEVAKAQQGLIETQAGTIRELIARVAAIETSTPPSPVRPADGNGR